MGRITTLEFRSNAVVLKKSNVLVGLHSLLIYPLWKIAKDRIAKRQHRMKTLDEMGNAIISSDLLEKLVISFSSRPDLCIMAKGGATKY